jgi:hypothetical protein
MAPFRITAIDERRARPVGSALDSTASEKMKHKCVCTMDEPLVYVQMKEATTCNMRAWVYLPLSCHAVCPVAVFELLCDCALDCQNGLLHAVLMPRFPSQSDTFRVYDIRAFTLGSLFPVPRCNNAEKRQQPNKSCYTVHYIFAMNSATL